MPRHLLPYCATYLLCALAAPASSAQPTSNTLIRFDFESGDMQGWKVVEGEFGALLSDQSVFWNDRSQPYNKQGKWFLSTLWSTEKKPNDRYKGVIESPVFKLLGPRMTFLVGGGSHDNTYVALCAANGNESLKACGANSEKMQRITWDAPNLVGRNVFLRIMDENEGGWGHVTFDDFTAQGILDPRATQRHFAAVAKKRISTLAQDVSLPALRRAIEDIAATYPGQYPGAYLKQLAEFENLLTKAQSQMAAQDAPGAQAGGAHERMDELMERIRAFQREALLANPLVCSKPILYISRRQYKSDHHNTETMFQTGEINTSSFAGGGAMKTVDIARGSAVAMLIETTAGLMRDPDVRYDGRKIVFSMRKGIQDDYKIYEIGADGSNLRQLTFAQGVTDIDPFYLPDGSIVFSSTREPKYCMCNVHIMANLFRMDADGANIHQLGKNTLFEGHGATMPDGRIVYDRWEYIDRNFGDAQSLWTCNPDGTNHVVYWGNNTASPGGVIEPRPIPGTLKMLCVLGSCHDRPWGALAILDRERGMDGREPVVMTWPPDAVNLVTTKGDGQWDVFKQVKLKYEDPYPLNDKYFLCSRMTGRGEEMAIYLVDVFGNEVLAHEEAPGCYDPMPLAPRSRPPVIPDRREYDGADGRFYVMDVYRGTHIQGVKQGAAKWLRVIESPEKRFWTEPAWGGQGVHRPAMNWHDFSNKRILGTVPVETDGSAYFAVPSGKFVYFQLLDANGMMIQSMRSGTMVQPGESQGCIGCHDERRTAPPLPIAMSDASDPSDRSEKANPIPLALKRPASAMKGWHGAPREFSYLTEVQPVFDKYCLSCHDFGKEGGKKLILAGDRDLTFNASYEELWRKKTIAAIGAGPAQIQPAYSWGSHPSLLIKKLREGHKGVKLDPESFDRLVTWIDVNAPYYPRYDTAYPNNLAGRAPLESSQIQRLTELTGIPFAKQATHNSNPGPQISFDRPSLSPCLSKFESKSDPKYLEALAIIQSGGKALADRPRGERTAQEDFQACEVDQRRQHKYDDRQRAELRNLEAIRQGRKVFDEK